MKSKITGLLLVLLFQLYNASAQTADDALLFSGTSVNGTARFQGLGGAQTALGADISSISGNPAGLGFFRKSEWSITPSLGFSNNNSSYLGNNTTDGKGNFNIANLGIVFASPKDDIIGGKWRGGAFGISFNRMNSFQNQFAYDAVNNRNSLVDAFVQQANGIPLADFEADLAPARLQLGYLTYLVNPYSDDPDETEYYSSVGASQDTGEPFPVRQRETVNYTGARYQWNFSYGGNYDDKLYFGASLGLSRIRYGITNTYRENVIANRDEMILDNFTLTEEVDIAGTGVNLSGGIIYKANDIIRFGASIVSPTYYWRLTDNFRPSITANYEYTENLGEDVPLSMTESIDNIDAYQYNLTTPMSASLGIAIFAGKNGFITADATYSTFNSIRLNAENGDDFSETNQFIRNNYQPAITARVGGEFRKDIFRLRGGFAYQGEAFKERVDNLDRTRLNFTAGAGVRLESFYFDVAVVHSRFNSGYTPYTYNPAPSVTTKNRLTNAVLSFGMFF